MKKLTFYTFVSSPVTESIINPLTIISSGINDPFYFSKCFKQQFGVAPSVYLRGKEESGIQETENKE